MSVTLARIVKEEPAPSGPICGYQLSHTTWTGRAAYCGERKAPGLYFCQEHHDWVLGEYGYIRMAPGNTRG